jgi:hypothetical protein
MGTCVERLISAMKAGAWAPVDRAKELDLATVAGHGCGMVGELSGVPRPALQTVFGKHLGRRIWAQGHRSAAAGVADEEIIGGMIEYVSKRAGELSGGTGGKPRPLA